MTYADALTQGIANAIRAHDFGAVDAMLRKLATVDPARAQAVYDTIEVAIESYPNVRPVAETRHNTPEAGSADA